MPTWLKSAMQYMPTVGESQETPKTLVENVEGEATERTPSATGPRRGTRSFGGAEARSYRGATNTTSGTSAQVIADTGVLPGSVASPLPAMTDAEKAEVPKTLPEEAEQANAATAPTAPAAPQLGALGDVYRQMSAATLGQYAALAPELDNADAAYKAAQQQQLDFYDRQKFRPLGFYEQLTKTLNPYRPPTAAEIQRRIKREKGQKALAAIGDGIAAIANLWGTSQGALNAFTGQPTLSGRYADMYETLRQERKANDEKYYNAYLNALAADDANAAAIRGNEATRHAVNVQNAQSRYASILAMMDKYRDKADKYDKLAADQDKSDRDFQLRQDMLEYRKENDEANRQLKKELKSMPNITVRVGGGGRGGGGRGGSSGGKSGSKTINVLAKDGKTTVPITIPNGLWHNDDFIMDVYNEFSSGKHSSGTKNLLAGASSANDVRQRFVQLLENDYYTKDKNWLSTLLVNASSAY